VRPAVSVGRTTALDAFSTSHSFNDLPAFSNNPIPAYSLGGFFDDPESSMPDYGLIDGGVFSANDTSDFNIDHLADYYNDVSNTFNIDDFVHHDENNQPAPEVQSSDTVAESTPSLQPHFGASSDGCDFGGNAVSV
jgi:transcriptional activator HAC1